MLRYDNELWKSFRERAITNPSHLYVGMCVFSNFHRAGFVIENLLTEKGFRIRMKLDWDETTDDTEIKWIVHRNPFNPEKEDYSSLHDNNVGDSYNPWLLFLEKKDMEECIEKIKIEYDRYEWID